MTLIRGAFYKPVDSKAFWRERGINPDDDRQRELGRVSSAHLESHDRAGLTVSLMFEFGGEVQGWPAYELSQLRKVSEHEDGYRVGTARGLTYVMRLCEMLRVRVLETAVGREVWCIRNRGLIIGMEQKKLDGGLIFIPADFWPTANQE